jgi:Fe-S cluster biogenesis protein NfuA
VEEPKKKHEFILVTDQMTSPSIPIKETMEKAELISRIDSALDDVRPHLAVDGGNVEVVDVTDDKIVKIKWLGNCKNCNMSIMTMRAGIEQAIRVKVPEITGVEAINGLVL